MNAKVNAKYVAEFIGTYLLVLTVGCNVLSGQAVWGGVSIACVLTVMIYAFASTSGANFNPAVSLSLFLSGNLGKNDMGIYMITQCAGGICGALTYFALFGKAFNLGPTTGHTLFQAAVAELLYTFMLCFVVLNTACAKANKGNQFYGLAIGFVIVAGAYSGGAISMGCFNPAVALGIDLSSAHMGFGVCFLYAIMEFLGAWLATSLYFVCRPDEQPGNAIGESTDVPFTGKCASEFIGTYILVLTVGLNVLHASAAGAFSIACSLMCMIFALGNCSGAHFNPAVTVAILFAGRNKTTQEEAGLYILSQLSGGAMGAFTYCLLKNEAVFALKPESSNWGQVFVAEFVFTFVLAFVVLSVATTKETLSQFFGLAIGMCVTVGGCAIGSISGGMLNPAVAFGVSSTHIIKRDGLFYQWFIYTAIEVLAGALAAAVFKVTQPAEYKSMRA